MEKNFTKDGLILLNKSKGVSSFAAINELKRKIRAKKVGHAGTLDPMAEGLMIVMINDATKFSDDLMKKEKEYYVEMELGYKTDTYDLEGTVVERYESEISVSNAQIIKVINSFRGKIKQIPPMYSAIKIDGKKLYDFALNFAKKEGCYNLTLDAWADNTGAVRFYEKLGMKVQKYVFEEIL